MCMSGRKSWFREQKRAKTFMGGGKTSVCEQKQPFMFTGDEKISIREQKWPKTCTDLQKDLYRLLFFRQAQQTVTEVVLKGGAPKAFGAYIKRCSQHRFFWLQPRREVVSNDYVTNTCISLLFWALWGFALFMGLTTSGCFRGFWAI